jgi:PAS domain S-box-containing protein
MSRWTISRKLIALTLLGVVGTIALVGWIGATTGTAALLEQQSGALEAVRISRQRSVEQPFRIIREQVFNFARNRMIVEATDELTEAFRAVAVEVGEATDDGGVVAASLRAHYADELGGRLREADRVDRGPDAYLPAAPEARILQAMYIVRNPHPVGEKQRLDRAEAPCSYNRLHAVYHGRIRDYLESFGFRDIFLFDLDGNLVYSVFKETDFATSFLDGPYAETNLGALYRRAREADDPAATFIVDFEPYEPSSGQPASFLGAPVFRDARKIGVAVFQMPVDQINGIMADVSGLGTTGQTFLVAEDGLMRSEGRFRAGTTILRQRVDTEAVRRAIAGETGVRRQTGYEGRAVLSSYGPLAIEGLRWAIVAEMDMDEVTAPAALLRRRIALLGIVVAVAVVLVSSLLLRRLVLRPVRQLAAGAERVERGDYETPVEAGSGDELGDLARAFNHMTASVAREVADRQRAEARVRTFLTSTNEGFWLVSNDAVTEDVNDAMCAILGRPREEILGRPIFDFVDERNADVFRGQIEQRARGEQGSYEVELRLPDGTATPCLVNATPYYDEQGRKLGSFGMVADISERRRIEDALRKVTRAVEQSSSIVVITDRAGDIEYVNPKFVEVSGYPAEEAIGRNPRLLKSGRQPQEVYEDLWSTLVAGREWHGELCNRRKDGELYWVAASMSPIRRPDGQITHYLAIEDDITESRRVAEALRASESRFRTLVGNIPGAVFRCRVDDERTVVYLSDEAERISGHPASEFIESRVRTIGSIVHPRDRDRRRAAFETAAARRAPLDLEYRIVHADGATRWVAEAGRFSYDERGRPAWCDGVIFDITERHAAQERFQVLFEQSSDAHLIFDETGIIDCNDAAVAMLRCRDRRELLAQHPAVFSPERQPDGRTSEEKSREMDARARERGFHRFDWAHRKMDGEVFPVEVTLTPVTVAEKPVLLAVWHDLTERKRVEDALLEAREAADAANQAKSDFLSNMSHELRTPLNGVLGYAQILQRDPDLTPRQKQSLGSIESCGHHLLTLINDVLDLSKIEAGRLEIERGPCDLHRLLTAVFDIVRPRAESKGLAIELDVAPEVPRGIVTDATKLKQTLVNLLGNAVKFTERGSVELAVRQPGPDRLELAVRDTGVGMSAEEIDDIFEPFRQATAGRASAGGTGLGLAISKRIVEALDGTLSLTSEPGRGSCFTIDLPLVEADEDVVTVAGEGTLDDHRRRVLVGNREIPVLVADDRQANRDILAHLLEDAGFRPAQARDGGEALRMMHERHYPLVLMDVRMPEVNGIEATRRIRSDPALRDTIVFAVTASVFPEFRDKAKEAGFDDFVAKPLRASELFTKIERHLDVRFTEAEAAPPAPAAAGTGDVPPDVAAEIAGRLGEAVRVRNVTALKTLAAELARGDDGRAALGRRIADLALAFDFTALDALVGELSGDGDG